MPKQQVLEVSLQVDLKLKTFLDKFDVLDFSQEIRGEIAELIQARLRAEDEKVIVVINDIRIAAES
jgi:hypothetical protein